MQAEPYDEALRAFATENGKEGTNRPFVSDNSVLFQ